MDEGDHVTKNARLTKAVALLFALEAGLDFDKGASVAEALSRFYRGCRDAVMRASIEGNVALVRDVVANVSEIADSWKAIGRA
jgi:flagellar protein FliS